MWYNTLIKYYTPSVNKSVRFVRYAELYKQGDYQNAKSKKWISDNPQDITSAENSADSSIKDIRNYKEESLARAMRTVKALIRQNYSVNLKLLTLTYHYVVTSKSKVLDDIKNMAKRYTAYTGRNLRYVATLEWQEPRHCLHVHMLIDSPYYPVDMWRDDFWLQGFIKVNSVAKGKSRSCVNNAVGYVLKYISKDCNSCDYYKHMYFRSKGWSTAVKKDYAVSKDNRECIEHAKFYLNTRDVHVDMFEYETFDQRRMMIIDVYVNSEEP